MKSVIYDLKNWRLQRGMTQEQAAAVLGVSSRSWSGYERSGEIPQLWFIALSGKLYNGEALPAETPAPTTKRKEKGVFEDQYLSDGTKIRVRIG